jgi:hypothetical protein
MDIDEYYNASYEVRDNFLSEVDFAKLEKVIMGPEFNWNYSYNVSDGGDSENDIYFMHSFYIGLTSKPKIDFHGNPIPPEKSTFYKFIEPIIEKLPDFQTLIRAKANLYVARKKLIHHKDHTDMEFSHKGAILYLNDNDGFTVLEDGTEIESKANRLLLFDPSKPHHSTSCTKDNRRVNININYL